MLGIKTIWSRSCGLRIFCCSPNFGDQSIRPTRSWDQKWPARHFDLLILRIQTIQSRSGGLRVHFDPRILRIKDLAPQDHGIKCGLRDTLIPNAGDQNILIPHLWPSRPFWSPNCGDQRLSSTRSWDQKCLRDTLIPQCRGSKDSDPVNVAFASFWSTNGEDRIIRSTRSLDQKWLARLFDLPILGIKIFWSRIFGLRVMVILELWGSNHEIHKIMGSKVGCAALFMNRV
jgi:hypothetical protein